MTAVQSMERGELDDRQSNPPGAFREFWHYFSANHGAVAGFAFILLLVICMAFAEVIAPYGYDGSDTANKLLPPFWQEGGRLANVLGTDAIGRDLLSRLIYGTRYSLAIGAAVVMLSIVVGTFLGLVAGFARGVVEIVILRVMDIILTLPSLLLALVILAILDGDVNLAK